ncbi:MAG: hypothetical protein QOD69_2950 [Solirubrobacteraceae bacterium]|jgi:hypothetical protein|nr:hypothetical protein [Solirubrobacteraceae bacterium]
MAPARDDRNLAVRLGAAVALFLLLVGQAQVTVLDGSSMLAVAHALVHHGSLAVPASLGVEGHDGLYYSKYGLLLPLLSVVPVALVQPIGAITGRVDLLEAAAAASLMPLVCGALAAAVFLLGRRLGAPRPAAALVGAGAVLGTYVLPYGRDFFTEPLVALGLVVMVERALAGRELQAGAALAFAVLARPQSGAFAPLLLAFLALREGGGVRAAARTLPPLAVAAIVTVAYNVYRFAEPLQFGYRPPVDPGFTTPLLEGTGGLLFSSAKSVFLFAPAIVLVPLAVAALWRSRRATALFVLAIFAVGWGLAATWWSWQGGWSWGPRLVIPVVVVALAIVAPWIGCSAARLRTAAVLFAIGFVVSLPAVLAPAGAQLLAPPVGKGPQIARQVSDLPALMRRSVRAAHGTAARDDDYRRYLAVWQAGITRQFGPWGVVPAILGTLLLLAALVWVARPLGPRLRPG